MAEHIGLRNYTDAATGTRVRIGESTFVPDRIVSDLVAAGVIAAPVAKPQTATRQRQPRKGNV